MRTGEAGEMFAQVSCCNDRVLITTNIGPYNYT